MDAYNFALSCSLLRIMSIFYWEVLLPRHIVAIFPFHVCFPKQLSYSHLLHGGFEKNITLMAFETFETAVAKSHPLFWLPQIPKPPMSLSKFYIVLGFVIKSLA